MYNDGMNTTYRLFGMFLVAYILFFQEAMIKRLYPESKTQIITSQVSKSENKVNVPVTYLKLEARNAKVKVKTTKDMSAEMCVACSDTIMVVRVENSQPAEYKMQVLDQNHFNQLRQIATDSPKEYDRLCKLAQVSDQQNFIASLENTDKELQIARTSDD